jgi:sialate O-acetylesterase
MQHIFDGRPAAGSLTYDDGLPVHREVVAPTLESFGLRGTFYTPISSDVVVSVDRWRAIAEAGHELGNHTVFHPCRRRDSGAFDSWLPERHDLRRFTLDEWRREVTLANRVLTLIDGRTERTFGNTCHHTTVGPEDQQVSINPAVGELFIAGRGARTEAAADPSSCDLTAVGCIGADARSFEQLKPRIDAAVQDGQWLVLCAHGVGGGHSLFWDEDEHRRTLAYLADRSAEVWTAPMVDVARAVARDRTAAPAEG